MMRSSHVGRLGGVGAATPGTMNLNREEWERTPRWMFWLPAWRRATPYRILYHGGTQFTGKRVYQTQRQRARDVLSQQFGGGDLGSNMSLDQASPKGATQARFNSGGYGRIEH